MPIVGCNPGFASYVLSAAAPAIADWHVLAVGGGGFVTGLDLTSDGTRVVRTDVGGGYVWNPATSLWVDLITSTTMPAGDVNPDYIGGIYEIRIAPSNTSRFYMIYNGLVYRSDNAGVTWANTGFTRQTGFVPNSGYENGGTRWYGEKLAVDPNNADVVYIGDPVNGWLWKTANAGVSWTHDTGVTASVDTDPATGLKIGITGIAFDPASGLTGGATNRIYCSNGAAIFTSANAGASWASLGAPPARVIHAIVANGFYYCVATSSTTALYRTAGGAITTLSVSITGSQQGSQNTTVTVDPSNSSRIIVGDDGGSLNISADGGTTWTGWAWGNTVATDIPWLQNVGESGYMTAGNILFDPAQSNKLIFSQGIGVWTATPPVASGAGVFNWTSITKGIEELEAKATIAPNGVPILVCDDRTVFYQPTPNVYPSDNATNTNLIIHGWDIDYATADSTFMVLADSSTTRLRKSADGGQTWSTFAATPYAMSGGCVAAQSSASIVACSFAGTVVPKFTANSGATWTNCTFAPIPSTNGWGTGGSNTQLCRKMLAADRVTSGVFYAFNNGATNPGIYKSTDGGANFSRVHTGVVNSDGTVLDAGFNIKLKTVPGNAGHLFFTNGQSGVWGDVNPDPADTFWHSTDAGVTWSKPNVNVLEVFDVGFGLAKPGGSGYPAVFIIGWVSGVFGVWQSDDAGVTWTQLGSGLPLNLFDFGPTNTTITGDLTVYGRCYISFGGHGWAYYGT